MVTSSQLPDVFKFLQQAFSSINGQGGFFTFNIAYTPNQREGSWKALAEAHLRERVKNPHNYRALSIELEGMKNAGFDWSKEYNLASLVRFLSRLYSTQISYQALWSKFETFTDTHTYQIQDATNYWNNYR